MQKAKKEDFRVEEELRSHLAQRFSRWQLPDAFVFLPEIPRTSVGKFQKSRLREMFACCCAAVFPELDKCK